MTNEAFSVNMNRDFKGIWIPREIWLRSELKPLEKMLWSEIHSLFNRDQGGCYATNEYLANFLGVTERYVRGMLKRLKDFGFLVEVSFDGRQRVVKAILPPEDFSSNQSGTSSRQRGTTVPGGGTAVPPGQESQFQAPIYTDKKAHNKDIAQSSQTEEPLRAKSKLEAIIFDPEKKEFSGISAKDLSDWQIAFPGIDIKRELALMKQWILSNPSKAKKTLWRKFITRWLTGAYDKNTNKQAYQSAKGSSYGKNVKDNIRERQLEEYKKHNGDFETNVLKFE
jgi:hypothetical protein